MNVPCVVLGQNSTAANDKHSAIRRHILTIINWLHLKVIQEKISSHHRHRLGTAK